MAMMTTSVSIWRCQCGINVKVVTQRDQTRRPSPPHTVLCPNCGNKHAVIGDRVLSVTDDSANTLGTDSIAS
jgi:hypothetical protein